MKLKIHKVVGEVMSEDKKLRLHKNRYELYRVACAKIGKMLSPESVMRSQRKWWSEGFYRPDDLTEFNIIRCKYSKEYRVFIKESSSGNEGLYKYISDGATGE